MVLTAEAFGTMMYQPSGTGGVAQGLGGALFEEFTYGENGDPLAVTFADYLLPTLSDVPRIETLITEDAPSPRNPLGLKGAGEAGVTGAAAAIAGAVEDALRAVLNKTIHITRVPVTSDRVRFLLSNEGPRA